MMYVKSIFQLFMRAAVITVLCIGFVFSESEKKQDPTPANWTWSVEIVSTGDAIDSRVNQKDENWVKAERNAKKMADKLKKKLISKYKLTLLDNFPSMGRIAVTVVINSTSPFVAKGDANRAAAVAGARIENQDYPSPEEPRTDEKVREKTRKYDVGEMRVSVISRQGEHQEYHMPKNEDMDDLTVWIIRSINQYSALPITKK